MKQPMYIRAATAISPQRSFDRELFLKPLISTDNGRLYALDAAYAQYINPVAIRRMSRIMKMTISAAMQCLREAGLKTPDAIITGTGRGGVSDMEVFVKDMIKLDEEALNPTAFIQSTYNSPNGWIAMQSGCTCYNQTYVHRGCSFELALLDAQMLFLEADSTQNILVGCYDEMTEEYYQIRGARAYWKTAAISSADLFRNSDTAGTIGGEGASFFVLSNNGAGATSCIRDMGIIHEASADAINMLAKNILSANGLTINDISLVLTGLNGDKAQSELYSSLMESLPNNTQVGAYKHLCGDYDTAVGFGLWLADYMVTMGVIPVELIVGNNTQLGGQNILLVNHFRFGAASVILVTDN